MAPSQAARSFGSTLPGVPGAGVGGGVFFGLDKTAWSNYWWLALASGSLMMLMDIISNRVWLVQLRGLSVAVKLLLLVLMGSFPAWDGFLLVVVIIISAAISHAPSKLRYYSVYHGKVIRSIYDTKG